MTRKIFCSLSVFLLSAMLVLGSTVAYAQQTPGQIVKFGSGSPPPLQDSSITEDPVSLNVGIGTTNPTANLHIVGGANTHLMLESSAPNGNPSIVVKANTPAGHALVAIDRADTGAPSRLTFATGGVGNWEIHTPVFVFDRLDIVNGVGVPSMSFLQNGNIGIGTTTPAEKLDVAGGNVNLDDSTDTTGNILKGGVPFLHNFGFNNTFIGKNAGNLTMTGGSNTASGEGALFSNTTGGNNTASGFAALQSNTTGISNTASGEGALFSNTTGDDNTASGVGALGSNTTGSNNTAIGFGANVSAGNLTNATAIGAGAIVDASNKIRLGNTLVTVVEGPPYSTVSDRTKKENFKPVDGEEVLRKIGGLSLTSWNYIGHDPKQFRHYGPVAQEFFAAFGHDGIGTIGTPTTINSGDMAGILMIAVQALEKRTAENADLKGRLEKLEGMVRNMAHQTAWSGPTE